MTAVVWQRVDTLGTEYAEIEIDPLVIEGEIILVEDGVPSAVSYRVVCDRAGLTSHASINLKRNGIRSDRTLVRGPAGHWTVNGLTVAQLDGLADVDLSVTPSTNTAPLRRLQLSIGQSAEVVAVWVKFPSLDVVPPRQSYRRIGSTVYAYGAPDLDFHAELEVDELGIVRAYGGLWRRLHG
jgi:hypothetical protein